VIENRTKLAVVATLVVLGGGLFTLAAPGEDRADKVVHVSSKDGKWTSGRISKVETIPIRGDMDKGPHAMFARFAPGADHGWHTHTNDATLVVISGAYLFKDEHGKEIRVGAGDYLFVPGGTKHWSGGDAKEGCTFYQESPGKFDLNKIEAPK
jgi:mannose-6-phosphate isomerase-like protein (cupin superfamily)